MATPTAIPEDRPLTAAEVALVRWLLRHGIPQSSSYHSNFIKFWRLRKNHQEHA
jgi:hypothetical protein